MAFSHRASRFPGVVALMLAILFLPHGLARAQEHPAEITPTQSGELPYRLSGRLNVTFGDKGYFGTSTYIRRYTGVTAGHLLYDPKGGFAVNPYYEPALYQEPNSRVAVSYFAVLSGYQDAANIDPDADDAFEHDMGYVLFLQPAAGAEWAAFEANPDALTSATQFLVLGYAAENFIGDELASISTDNPFYELQAPGLYENKAYYTESGMSGGPTYFFVDNVPELVAVTVAGTDAPDPALSDVRAITATEFTLFTEAEYTHGLITSGTIQGPAGLAPGGTGKYKVGVVFKDGAAEGSNLPRNYDELTLRVHGHRKKKVSITKIKTGKFKIKFSDSLPGGTDVVLELVRTTAPSTQTPLQTLTVAVQTP